jgi:hypothetical protein
MDSIEELVTDRDWLLLHVKKCAAAAAKYQTDVLVDEYRAPMPPTDRSTALDQLVELVCWMNKHICEDEVSNILKHLISVLSSCK